MQARRFLAPAVVVVAFSLGCDPKLTGTEDTSGTGGTTQDAVVTAEALAVGSIVSFHNDIMAAGLSLADAYAGGGAGLRSIGTACMTIASLETSPPSYSLDLAGCSNEHGTSYTGTASFEVGAAQPDGYTFFPDFGGDSLIRARNESVQGRNHDLTEGSLSFDFQRNASDQITGVTVGSTIRHTAQAVTVTFGYADVTYTGAPGTFAAHPDAGSTINVVRDGFGTVELQVLSGGNATYTIGGVPFVVDLATGDVSVAQ